MLIRSGYDNDHDHDDDDVYAINMPEIGQMLYSEQLTIEDLTKDPGGAKEARGSSKA